MDKLRAIKFFCRAVEAKSFTSAAHALDVPPSVLSKMISALETELRFTLFNRSTRRLSLTEAGTCYYDYCRQLLLDMEETESVARQGTVQPAGTLRIGFHPAFRASLFRRIGEFLAENRSVNIEAVLTNSPATLLDEGLDVVLRIGGIPDSGFEVVTVPVIIVVRDGIGMSDSALAGVGIAQIYDVVSHHHIVDGSLEPILTDWSYARQPVYAVIPSRRNVPAKVRAFVQFARSLVTA